MVKLNRRVLALGAAVAVLALLPGQAAAAIEPQLPVGNFIVVLNEEVSVGPALSKHRVEATHRYSHVVNGFAAPLTKRQLAALERDPSVALIEPDGEMRITATQLNPPSWGLDRIDQRNRPLDNRFTYNATGAGVHAYIIDTGIVASHSEFGGRAQQVVNFAGGSNTDCHGHGTHVAGTVGGTNFGVAKQVRLYGVKVLNCAGSGSNSSVIAGMDWVAANHIKPAVANMSLGGGFSSAVNSALNRLANSGVFVAVASGNSNANACNFSPASASNATTVNASDSSDRKASFSNWGSCTHLYAPGVSIRSIGSGSMPAVANGTSMATPHVTGVAALYKQTFGDHSFSTIRSWLITNATSGVISGNPSGTPNRLLYTNGL